MDEIEIPQYFVCPISLQIMKDPVTAVTGITYDRETIEKWLKTAKDTTCPVTKQPLPKDSDLTPNHTLRRLIQAWCVANAKNGIDRIPTPKSPLNKRQVLKLLRDIRDDQLRETSLEKIENLAKESEKNRKIMVEAGVGKAIISFVTKCFKEKRVFVSFLEQCLTILNLVWSVDEIKDLVNQDFFDTLTCILVGNEDNAALKTKAMGVLKLATEIVQPSLLERLKPDFFNIVTSVLRKKFSQQAFKSALHILILTSPYGRNRIKIIEGNTVFLLIEMELEKPERSISELIFSLLASLCFCAEGRAEFLMHSGGIAMVSKRILRVSPAVDDRGVNILSSIAKFSGRNDVLLEMLSVGAVTKLCMVIQADCDPYLKAKASGVLRLHSGVWSNSPCIELYLLTRYERN